MNDIEAAAKEKKSHDMFAFVFLALIAWQTAHMVEHVAQVIQKFVQHKAMAHGLVGRFDLEWVHFIYNLSFLAVLYFMLIAYNRFIRNKTGGLQKMFMATIVVQSYHMFEHVVKITQHVNTGKQGTPGILGHFVNIIWFHFYINLAVLLLAAIAFFQLGLHKRFISIVSEWIRVKA